MTRQATQLWGPVFDAMNTSKGGTITQFAGGVRVGGDAGGLGAFGHSELHIHIDRSIHAPGADPANLQRIVDRQDQFERDEPARWYAYAQGAGAVRKNPRKPF